MSYNITSVTTKVLDARMRAADVIWCLGIDIDDAKPLPESCFLREMKAAAQAALDLGAPNTELPLPNFWWSGEWSGHAYEDRLPGVAAKILGAVEAIFTWEGGDSFTAVVIADGEMSERVVTLTIGGEP